MRRDYRSEPVRRMVVMGESNAFGMCASDPRNEWVQTVGNLIRDFQDEPLVLYNNSIPANVISPRSPGYACLPAVGKPSAVERYQEDLLAPRPDLVILAYGLNDSRCGNPVASFITDFETVVRGAAEKTEALIVLAGPYWNTQYNREMWEALNPKPEWATGEYEVFAKIGRALVWSYVAEIERLAKRYECLFVDLFSPTEDCPWLLHEDQCHFNDVGQRVLGNLVFGAIAANCSFVARRSQRLSQAGSFDTTNTGGTQGQSRMIQGWLKR